jgi:D-3-phosphoglycerate dehydrogenase/(S)-sulfolactate dehydrogenase
MLDQAPELRVLARSGVGYDSIDVAAAAARGIRVCNTPGVNHDAVAELTIALMLITARRLTTIIDGVRAGRWPRDAGHELRGATLGLLGYGPSGRAVAGLGAAFGMTVLVHTAHPHAAETGVQFVDRDTVIAAADYLSLHTRSDATTHRIIGREALRAMKTTAILINTAAAPWSTRTLSSRRWHPVRSPAPPSTSSTSSQCRPTASCAHWTMSSSPHTLPAKPSRPAPARA